MKPLYLEFVNKGVANRFDCGDHDLIEMNENLKKYPKLFYSVLMHELGHGEKNTLEDFKHDMKSKTPGLFRFMVKHPLAFLQVLPFYYDMRRNKVVYDVSYIASWIMIAGITVIVFFLMKYVMGWLL